MRAKTHRVINAISLAQYTDTQVLVRFRGSNADHRL